MVSPLWAAAMSARSEPEPLSWLFMTMSVLSSVRFSIGSSQGRNRRLGARQGCGRARTLRENGNLLRRIREW